jgi:hypothetical protein
MSDIGKSDMNPLRGQLLMELDLTVSRIPEGIRDTVP